MKYLLLAALVLSLPSCNTCIGIGRDCKHAFNWTKEKLQGDGGGSSQQGAPVY